MPLQDLGGLRQTKREDPVKGAHKSAAARKLLRKTGWQEDNCQSQWQHCASTAPGLKRQASVGMQARSSELVSHYHLHWPPSNVSEAASAGSGRRSRVQATGVVAVLLDMVVLAIGATNTRIVVTVICGPCP